MTYRRSLRLNDSSAWTDDVPVGAGTWERANGSSVEFPARPEQMDLLGRHLEPFDEIQPGLVDRIGWRHRAIKPAAGRKPAFIYHDGPARGDGDRGVQTKVFVVTSE